MKRIKLQEIDDARNDYITLIASGTIDEEAMDEQFQKLYTEEHELNSRLKALEENNIDNNKRSRMTQTLQSIENNSCELVEYNDMLVRKLIECIKVNSKTEIMVIFKGGIETTVNVENEVSSHMDRLNDSYASFLFTNILTKVNICAIICP